VNTFSEYALTLPIEVCILGRHELLRVGYTKNLADA
jgi:hypothetical protein